MDFPLGLKRCAAMVVLRHERSFLLLERDRAPNAGMFVPVGGKLEPFEDPYTAALREAHEETGIRLDAASLGGVLTESSPTAYNWLCHIYLADIPHQPPPACDEGTLHWVAYDDVPQRPTPPTDWHIYQYLMRGQPFVLNAVYDEDLRLRWMVEELEGKNLLPG